MRKLYFTFRFLVVLVLFFKVGKSFSQAITINTSTYTPTQLVTDVFSNANCNLVTNVTSSSGNGVAYFQNSNPSFPLQSGIVISSGNASQIVGANSNISSTGSGASDSDMATTLGVSNFTDASFLSYSFVANSNSLSFDYLFASEEYGNYQCTFSDGIAFILTDLVTGISTNLAIVPGTTLPVSTNTIRNSLYNTNCASVNSQFFGIFNEINPVSTSGTNFNGQTIKMTANGTVIPNRAYKLKIVVADRADSLFDSAIFLSANSFNTGIPTNVLGPDVYLCSGTTQVLQTNLSASNYTFSWKKDGFIISNENMSSLVINQSGSYEVLYTNIVTGCESSDEIIVNIAAPIVVQSPSNFQKCGVSGSTNFNLTTNIPTITNGNPDLDVSFYTTDVNAQNSISPILNTTSFIVTGSSTIYIRVVNIVTGCYVVLPQMLQVIQSPVLIVTNPTFCATESLVSIASPVLTMGSSPGTLSYWYDSACTVPLNPNSITQSGTYYIKNTNICGSIIRPIVVTINLRPYIGNFPDVTASCYYILPSLLIGSYYTGPNGTGAQIMPTTIILASTTLYVYAQNNGCSSNSTLNIIINQALATPVISTLNDNHEIYISGTNVAQPLLLETQTNPDGCFYEWFVDGVAIPNSNSASYLVNTVSTSDFPRVFTVKVSTCVPLNCQATSQSFEVIQSPVPAPIGNPNQTFTEGQTLANLLVNGSNIKWYDGALNRNLNSTLLPLSTPLVSGTTYFASQTINSYESPTRLPVLATSTALATSQFNELDFLLSPNPVNDVLQLKANEIIKNITVYSVIGQEVLNYKNTASEMKLDLSKLTSGNYFVKIETEISQKTYKIIKQ
jgi:Secretion system C-terminal sorting domain